MTSVSEGSAVPQPNGSTESRGQSAARRRWTRSSEDQAAPAPAHWGIVAEELTIEVPDGRGRRVLLEDFSLDCRPGSVTAIAGPSGSGKTTLLTCLAGVAEFQGGRVWIAGRERRPRRLARPAELRDIGFMFQDYRLIRSLTVRDNVAVALRVHGWPWRHARHNAKVILEQLDLGDRLRDRPSALSGGEQQRVAFARAAIIRPRVVLADEPTAHLDRASTRVLASFILGLAESGACVVVSTHDPELMASCQHHIELR